jgi:hypothetical protein
MKTRLFPLLFIALFLFSCADSSVAPPETGVIMPLKVGNVWVARLRAVDKNDSTIKDLVDTLMIIDEFTHNGETWYGASDGDSYINRADGLWKAPRGNMDCQCKVAKYPAQKGDTVHVGQLPVLLSGPGGYDSVATIVTAVNMPTTVPAGTFNVYRYQPMPVLPAGAILAAEERLDFAPNVGLVRRDIRYAAGNRILWELKSVTLK